MMSENAAGLELMKQIAAFQRVIDKLQAAVDDITGTTDPETATWCDVSRYAHLVDALRRAELI
jgi:hypothetical protein